MLALTVVTPLYGKLGDLYGRKIVLQAALVIFLIGSVLCGMAQGMTELIAFRASRASAARGLMVSAQAAVGDVVSPRERGSLPGLFGAVFGVSSVIGPLVGGFFTTHICAGAGSSTSTSRSALLALVALAVTLPRAASACSTRSTTRAPCCSPIGLSALVLLTTLGRQRRTRWGSAQIVGARRDRAWPGSLAFLWTESRAAEPILPLHAVPQPRLRRHRARSAS